MAKSLKSINFREMLQDDVCIYDVKISVKTYGLNATDSESGHVFAKLDQEGQLTVDSHFLEEQDINCQREIKAAIGKDCRILLSMLKKSDKQKTDSKD